MKITGARIGSFVKSPPADIIGVLIYGPNQGLVSERAQSLAGRFCQSDDPFALTQLTADDLASDPAKLHDEMVAQSLLGGERLVRVRLAHERPGAALSKIIKALDTAPQTCAAKLIVEAGDMTPRSAVRKAFEAAKNFAALPCYQSSAADIAGLVKSVFAADNITIERSALDMLLPLIGADHGLAKSEAEKLALYAGKGGTLNEADIHAVASGAAGAGQIDDIIYAAMDGQPAKADTAYRNAIAGKTAPSTILLMLQRHLLRLHQAASIMQDGGGADAAIGSLRPPVFFGLKPRFRAQLQLWPLRALSQALSQTITTEREVKRAQSPAESLVGHMILSLAGFAAKRR